MIELHLERADVLRHADVTGRQALIGLGCVAGNIRLAARAYGWETRAHIVARRDQVAPTLGPGTVPVVRLELVEEGTPGVDEGMLARIRARKVIRSDYDERFRIDDPVMAELRSIAARFPQLELHVLTDRPTLLFIGKFQELAEATVYNREEFARELGDWLLPNDSDAHRGMRGWEFGLDDAAAARMHDGLARRNRLLPDELAGFTRWSNLSIRTAAAVLVISCAEDDVSGWLAAGELYEELALAAWRHGIATSLQASAVEVESSNLALRARLRTKARPTVIFRVGRPLHPEDWERPHAARPDLSELLLPG